MMKKKQENMIIVAAVFMFAVPCMVFAGGGQNSSSTGTAFSGAGAPRGYAVPVSQGGELTDRFTLFASRTVLSPDDTPMQRDNKQKTGIDFVVRGIQSTDVQTSLNLMLASGEQLADLMLINRNTIYRNAMIESGKVLELSFLYNSTSLKNIPNIPKKIKDFITEPDGKIYVFPGRYAADPDDPFSGWTLGAFWIRTDLMSQAGVTEQDIATIEGFENALRKFRALRNPAGQPMIPLSFRLTGHNENLILAAFGVDMSGSISGMPAVMEINGSRVFAFDNPNFLEAYKWINRLYNEGLIDMEATTQTAER
jgi:putative aldouronate transport system substrate-binding protein